MRDPWLGIGLVLAALAGSMTVLSAARRRGADPEWVRKALHIAMGLVTLTFPYLFAAAWPVLLLAAAAAFFLLAVRLHAPLRLRFGGVLHDVSRPSLGEVYFAAAAALLFLLSRGEALLFCVPMLILTLADPAAALVGQRYGSPRSRAPGDVKSVAGSSAFLGVALLCVYVPLRVFTGTGQLAAVLTAVLIAVPVTLLEAVARRGLDNLLIPLGAFVLLRSFLGQEITTLLVGLVAAIALTGFAISRQRQWKR